MPVDGNYHYQWRLGFSSLFAWAIAIAPFKDNFYSTATPQPGGSVGNNAETSPGLQAAISVLSAGPVTPGDGVGFADAALILRTCTSGGRILRPTRAATAIDSQIVARVFPSNGGPQGEVYGTYSEVSGWLFDTVLGAALTAPYAVTTGDVAGVRRDAALRNPGSVRHLLRRGLHTLPRRARLEGDGAPATVAYTVNTTTFNPASLIVQPFATGAPIPLAICDETDWQLWHTAPVLPNGWAYLGELAKIVPVSDVRTVSLDVFGEDLTVTVTGEAGEAVTLWFWNSAAPATPVQVACVLDAAGRATAAIPYGQCA